MARVGAVDGYIWFCVEFCILFDTFIHIITDILFSLQFRNYDFFELKNFRNPRQDLLSFEEKSHFIVSYLNSFVFS